MERARRAGLGLRIPWNPIPDVKPHYFGQEPRHPILTGRFRKWCGYVSIAEQLVCMYERDHASHIAEEAHVKRSAA
jgi:hypothetical protein